MLQILEMVAPLFGLILLGYVSGRIKKIPLDALAWMNFFIVYIALPALFFNLLSQTPMEAFGNASFLLKTTLATLAIFILCFTVAKFRRDTIGNSTIQGFAGAYGNIGYMGPPLALAAFGPEAGVPVALIFCLDNTMHFTLAPLLMAINGNDRPSLGATLSGIAKKIFSHPFILATIVGIAAASAQYQPPDFAQSLLDMLAQAAAPCALFVMGVTAALRPLKRMPSELTYLVPIKLILQPALVYVLLVSMTDLPTVWLQAAVLMAALPTATNVFVLAQQYQTWEQRASSAVVVSTALSIVSVTLWLYLLSNVSS
jgi:predicted permease